MATKLIKKHIGYSDSIVMKELEKIAIKEDLIKFEKKPEIQVKASAELKETGDVFMDAITLASFLRDRGFKKQASLLEKRALEYKEQDNKNNEQYNWWGENGDSFLEYAHKNDYQEPVQCSNNYGDVEDNVEQHKKVMMSINRQPTNKNASINKKKLINEINLIAQEIEEDPNWKAMKANISKAIEDGIEGIKKAKSMPSGGIPLKPIYENKLTDEFKKITGLTDDNLNEYIALAENKTINIIIQGGNPNLYSLGLLDKLLKGGNIELSSWKNLISSPYFNTTASSEIKKGCQILGVKFGDVISQAVNNIKNYAYRVVNSSITMNEAKIAVFLEKQKALNDYTRIYGEIRTKYNENKNIKTINSWLRGGLLNELRKPIWSASDNLFTNLKSLNSMLGDKLRFNPDGFENSLDNVITNCNTLLKVFNSASNFYNISNKAGDFTKYSEEVNKNINNCSNDIDQTKKALYEYKAYDKNLRMTPSELKVDINAMVPRIERMIKGWITVSNEAAKVPGKLNEDIIEKIQTELKLGTEILKAFKNANNSKPYAYFYRSMPKGSIPKDVKELEGVVATWENELAVSNKYINELVKGAHLKNEVMKLGFGGGFTGIVPTQQIKSPSKGTGTGTYSAPKKVSKEIESNIQVMQKGQEDFAAYAKTLDIKEDRETDIAEAIDTAKQGLKGANPDGIWGPNTQTSLETIQRYIDTNPALKGKIKEKIHSAKPAGESESEIIKNVRTNIVILGYAQALLGNDKYKKLLPYVLKSSGYDTIPKMYTPPIKGNVKSFMPIEDGINISEKELSSLGQLKGYLNSKGYNITSASGIEEVK